MKNGEEAELGVVLAPDAEQGPLIMDFLRHKGGLWSWHLEQALGPQGTPGLACRFYLLRHGRDAFSHIMTVEAGHTAILGHVFTPKKHRRKGAAALLMARVVQDYALREPRGFIGLSTDFDGPPYHLYLKSGFRGVEPGSGDMERVPDPDALETRFSPGAWELVDPAWEHWPQLEALNFRPGGPALRSYAYKLRGRKAWEWPFLDLYKGFLAGDHRCRIAVKRDNRAVVGYGFVTPDPSLGRGNTLLDIFCHPGFEFAEKELLESLRAPAGSTARSYVSSDAPHRAALLKAEGWRMEGTLSKALAMDGAIHDVWILASDSR
ncbi:MAG TPA: hypothetical protein VK914_11180 [bacterium]|nr:hypothetical protein [bacterium]